MIPTFPECDHLIIQRLTHSSDQELIRLLQQHSEKGQYFTAIFCRYNHLVYSLINSFVHWHSPVARNQPGNRRSSPVQAEYLFAKTWQYIFHHLRQHNLQAGSISVPVLNADMQLNGGPEAQIESALQNWILTTAAAYVNQTELLPVEAIHYSLSAASPPLWCYLEAALDRLPATLRLMVIMAQTFHWSETRIAAYLQAEGEAITATEVQARLEEGYQLLETLLPEDIRELYLGYVTASKTPLELT